MTAWKQGAPEGRSASRPAARWPRAVAVLLCLLGPVLQASFGDTPREYQLKAAFLYNFTKFVEWPASRFADTNSPIVIGVFGKNPFGAELENLVKGRKINDRGIVVRSVGSAADAKAAHLLFVDSTSDDRLAELQGALQGGGVLTVGESTAFARHDGIINFLLEDDKLRFEINMDAADRAGLRINAQLQKLAKTIRRKPRER
jgi:hypothetical protein